MFDQNRNISTFRVQSSVLVKLANNLQTGSDVLCVLGWIKSLQP